MLHALEKKKGRHYSLPPSKTLSEGACERHLYGSRETLVRIVRDTCTAREQHLHGSRATLARLASNTCVEQREKKGHKKRPSQPLAGETALP